MQRYQIKKPVLTTTLFASLLLVAAVPGAQATEAHLLNCREKYELNVKLLNHAAVELHDVGAAAAAVGVVGSLALVLASPPAAVALFTIAAFSEGGATIASTVDATRAERMEALLELSDATEAGRNFVEATVRAANRVRPGITEGDLDRFVDEGLDNGSLCREEDGSVKTPLQIRRAFLRSLRNGE